MKKFLIILLGFFILGFIGYFLGQMLVLDFLFLLVEMVDKEMEMKKEEVGKVVVVLKEIFYKMLFGKFIVQVMQFENVLYIVIDMDVYFVGVSEFEWFNGVEGCVCLCDGVIGVLLDMVEIMFWVNKGEEQNLDCLKMIEEIVCKMYQDFNVIWMVWINEFNIVCISWM